MKICRKIIAAILLAAAISGCAAQNVAERHEAVAETENVSIDNDEAKRELLELADNETPADELITTVYEKDELKTFISLADAFLEQTPECVRTSGDMIYFVYKYGTNDYLFLMYNVGDKNQTPVSEWYSDKKMYNSEEGKELFPVSAWYLGKRSHCEDFENLAGKNASINEVMEFDPNGDYRGIYASSDIQPFSLHHTVDGYEIILEYSGGEVSKIVKWSGEDNTLFYNLLPIDKELTESV